MEATLADVLRPVLAAGAPLRLAVLFGSAARGRSRPDSDVDVAILPQEPALPLARELELQSDLARACGRPVDLVRIDHASTLLGFEIARSARVLLEAPPGELARFRARALSEHLEFAPALARAAERFRRQLATPEETS